jgi:hypothetical protein
MIIIRSSYDDHHTIIIRSSYDHHTIIIRSSYDHHTIIIRSSYDHHTIIIWSSYDLDTIIIWSSYDHHTIIIRSSYDHHAIIRSSYDHRKKFFEHRIQALVADTKSICNIGTTLKIFRTLTTSIPGNSRSLPFPRRPGESGAKLYEDKRTPIELSRRGKRFYCPAILSDISQSLYASSMLAPRSLVSWKSCKKLFLFVTDASKKGQCYETFIRSLL